METDRDRTGQDREGQGRDRESGGRVMGEGEGEEVWVRGEAHLLMDVCQG